MRALLYSGTFDDITGEGAHGRGDVGRAPVELLELLDGRVDPGEDQLDASLARGLQQGRRVALASGVVLAIERGELGAPARDVATELALGAPVASVISV